MDSKNQHGSTTGWIRGIPKGTWAFVQNLPPREHWPEKIGGALPDNYSLSLEYYVHPVDTARLHVAAATDPSIQNKRIMAYAEPYDWNQILDIGRKVLPEAEWPANLEKNDKDLSTVDNAFAKEILQKRFGQDGFQPLEKGVRDALEC